MRVRAVTTTAVLLSCLTAAGARAVSIDEYIGSAATGIAFNQWQASFIAYGSQVQWSFPTRSGSKTVASAAFGPAAAGVDGTFWVLDTAGGKVWHLDTSFDLTPYTVGGTPSAIAVGADGNLWITESSANKIARVDWKTGAVDAFDVPTANSIPTAIALAGDGNVWFTEYFGNKVGRVTPAGHIDEFPLTSAGAHAAGIAAYDRTLAITEPGVNKIALFSIDGGLAPHVDSEVDIPTPAAAPQGITFGPDLAFWFVEYSGNKVGRVTSGGAPTMNEYPIPTPGRHPRLITPGEGGLWFNEETAGAAFLRLRVPGDTNGDGHVDVADVFHLINYLFAGGPWPQ